jgi:ABC-type antimicrobial peptide transport system permease subunit
MFVPSAGEAVIGSSVRGRYVGAELGDSLRFGRRAWTVVGVFESKGSSFESEIWVDVRELGNDVKRPYPYSGFRLRAASAGALARLEQRIDADPRYALEAQPEAEYYAKQAESANTLYFLVVAVAVLSGIGAGFGASNTMYAAVQARVGEIGTLRALGFSRAAILVSFQVEAALLGLAGFAIGAVAALGMAALIRVLLGNVGFGAATFTTNVVTLRLAPNDFVGAAVLAVLIGLVGGLGPAWRAAHLRPIEALHKA